MGQTLGRKTRRVSQYLILISHLYLGSSFYHLFYREEDDYSISITASIKCIYTKEI